MAAEQIKYIVSELNKPPYKKNYNLVSFSQLESIQLLQILNNVFSEIKTEEPTDIRAETPEQTVIRFLQTLRILKYQPPGNPATFRNGLVSGDATVVYPILEWCFRGLEMHKKRAYLAKYLLKVEVPAEVMDQDIMEIYQSYEATMEEFKLVHKEYETLKQTGLSAQEVRKDIANMEEEKETLIQRVDRVTKKVAGMSVPKKEEMQLVCRQLRVEKEKEQQLNQQRNEFKNTMVTIDQKIQKLSDQLKQMKASGSSLTPDGLIKRLEDEQKDSMYLANEKLPKELASKKDSVTNLQKIVNTPALGQAEIDEINSKLKVVNREIAELTNKRMMNSDPEDDKLALFRQQATIIAKKKETAAGEHKEIMRDRDELRVQLGDRRFGGEILKGEDFKIYVNQLRSKSTVYKKKRLELQEIRAEVGVLSRTEEILSARDTALQSAIHELESQRGVSGFKNTQEKLEEVSAMKSDLDEVKGKALQDISGMVKTLTFKINEKKNELAPLIRELRPMRQKESDLRRVWEEKKEKYDSVAAGLESHRSKLEQEVKELTEKFDGDESRYHYLNTMKLITQVKLDKIAEEAKAQSSGAKDKSMKEQLTKLIQQEEADTPKLQKKMNSLKDSLPQNAVQMKMWRDLAKMMDTKMRLQTQVYNVSNAAHYGDGTADIMGMDMDYSDNFGSLGGADRLVL